MFKQRGGVKGAAPVWSLLSTQLCLLTSSCWSLELPSSSSGCSTPCLILPFTLTISFTRALFTPACEFHGNVWFWLWANTSWHLKPDFKSLPLFFFYLLWAAQGCFPLPLPFWCWVMPALRHFVGTRQSITSFLAKLQAWNTCRKWPRSPQDYHLSFRALKFRGMCFCVW